MNEEIQYNRTDEEALELRAYFDARIERLGKLCNRNEKGSVQLKELRNRLREVHLSKKEVNIILGHYEMTSKDRVQDIKEMLIVISAFTEVGTEGETVLNAWNEKYSGKEKDD